MVGSRDCISKNAFRKPNRLPPRRLAGRLNDAPPLEPKYTLCDCLVLDGGPAGLTAAIYLGRFRRKVLLIDSGDSRAALIPGTHNYPGFDRGISGRELLA